MQPTKKEPAREDLERWENEGGSTPARLRRDVSAPRRHIHQPGHRTQGGLWGMASRLLEGVGQMFGIRRHQSR
jgi:hypothetical protein